jgi:hypothetical protein
MLFCWLVWWMVALAIVKKVDAEHSRAQSNPPSTAPAHGLLQQLSSINTFTFSLVGG